jgi:phosphoglycolate phosphatase
MTASAATVNVLFDLDGTLTDPGDGFVACITYALRKLDCRPYSHAEIRKHVGPPLEETLKHLLDGESSKIDAAVALYRQRYSSEGYLQNAVYPGVEAALRALRANRAALFVATSKPLIFAERILAHFGLKDFFQGIYGSQLDGTHSNKAQVISHVLDSESLAATSTVMIGDRAHDVLGALANGVCPIGALWGYGSREELSSAGAALLCEHPSQVPTILSSNRLMQPTGRERPAAD